MNDLGPTWHKKKFTREQIAGFIKAREKRKRDREVERKAARHAPVIRSKPTVPNGTVVTATSFADLDPRDPFSQLAGVDLDGPPPWAV